MTVGIDSRNDIPEGIATLALLWAIHIHISVLIAEDMAVGQLFSGGLCQLGT